MQDAELITPLIDASAAINVTLEFAHDFATGLGGASGTVKVRSSITGGGWVTKETYTGGDSAGTMVLDITPEAAGAADVEVNWHYQGMLDEYWAIDNVVVEASLPCDVSTGCACACILPDVAYDAAFDPTTTLTQACGDGDIVVEPGEEWNVAVQLINNSFCAVANNVKADLAANAGSAVAAAVCNNPGLYGVMPGGATAQFVYSFVVDSGAVCVNDITFDVTNVVSDEATYPDQIPAFNVTVGAATANELGTQATDPLNATGAPATSNFAPDFTLAAPVASASLDWASLTHDFAGTLNDTYSPVPAAVARKVTTIFTLAVAEVQTVTDVTTTINLTPPVRDSGGDTLDVILQSPAPALTQQVVYSGNRALWASGTFGPYAAFNGEGSGGVWQLIVTHTAGGGSGSDGTLNQWDLAIDYGNPGDVTANTKVEFLDPAGTPTLIKDYGAADPPKPIDMTAYYTVPGTYQIRLSEDAGGTATLTGATLDVDVTAQCDAGACACPAAPPSEPSPPGALEPLIIPTKDADQIIIENVENETGYVVYENAIGTWYGTPSQTCLDTWNDLGSTVQLNYPMAVGDRWVVVSSANATGESSCGMDSAALERNTSPGWPATGPCP
jgi:subtilisin-like proprotein convertase family protein